MTKTEIALLRIANALEVIALGTLSTELGNMKECQRCQCRLVYKDFPYCPACGGDWKTKFGENGFTPGPD
jgi:hypothetical protein